MRSSRRNIAASKPSSSKEDGRGVKDGDFAVKAGGGNERAGRKGLFVKINMDGVPIGRKVELKEHGSYADLSAAVDKLFRGLLAGKYHCSHGAPYGVNHVGMSDAKNISVCACSSKGPGCRR